MKFTGGLTSLLLESGGFINERNKEISGFGEKMKVIFIFGSSQSGKSTLMDWLTKSISKDDTKVANYEAGAWCRKAFKEHYGFEFDNENRMLIDNFYQDLLKKDPNISLKAHLNYLGKLESDILIISGIRNTDDFKGIVDYCNQQCFCDRTKDQFMVYHIIENDVIQESLFDKNISRLIDMSKEFGIEIKEITKNTIFKEMEHSN